MRASRAAAKLEDRLEIRGRQYMSGGITRRGVLAAVGAAAAAFGAPVAGRAEDIERHGISTDHLDPSWSKRYVHARTATPFHDNR